MALLKSIHHAALATLLLSVYDGHDDDDDDDAYIQGAAIGQTLIHSPVLLPGFIV